MLSANASGVWAGCLLSSHPLGSASQLSIRLPVVNFQDPLLLLLLLLQGDLLRPLGLPALLVGDPALGGIATTLSAYESLLLRGHSPAAVIMMADGRLNNVEAVAAHLQHAAVHRWAVVKCPVSVVLLQQGRGCQHARHQPEAAGCVHLSCCPRHNNCMSKSVGQLSELAVTGWCRCRAGGASWPGASQQLQAQNR